MPKSNPAFTLNGPSISGERVPTRVAFFRVSSRGASLAPEGQEPFTCGLDDKIQDRLDADRAAGYNDRGGKHQAEQHNQRAGECESIFQITITVVHDRFLPKLRSGAQATGINKTQSP